MKYITLFKVAILFCGLQSIVFVHAQEKLSLQEVIVQAHKDMCAINRSQPTSPTSATKHDAIIAKLDSAMRDEDYSHINEEAVKKLNREDCLDCFTMPFIGIAAALVCDFSHEMIHSYSSWACEKRLRYAEELQYQLDKKNK